NDAEPISGTGYTPNGKVDISIQNSVLRTPVVLSTLTADASGAITGTVILPLSLDAGSANPNTLIAADATTPSLSATASLIGVAVQPAQPSVSPTKLTPGGVINSINGTGFGAGGPADRNQPDVLTLYLGDVPLITTTTGPAGNFSVFGVPVPSIAPSG